MTDEQDLKYTTEHEWIRLDGSIATVGITAYAAQKLGDIVFVDLPKVGAVLVEGTVVGEIESTKSVGEVFSPVQGTVIEANAAVIASPELINSDPFGAGWLLRVEFADLPDLLDLAAYRELTGE